MVFSKTNVVWVLVFAAIVAGCTNRDKAANNLKYDGVYFDYSINGEENGENVTCMFQYKEDDVEGRTLDVEPAKVTLDGQQLQSGSAKLSGFFYEVQKPIDSFAGKHVVVFTTPNNKEYKTEFEFLPFSLAEELPGRLNRKPFTIQLNNFPASEKSIRLLVLDTAFASPGFNDLVPVENGKINIDQAILNTITKGPINLELYMEQEIPLKQATKAGGRLVITFGLKREFELVN